MLTEWLASAMWSGLSLGLGCARAQLLLNASVAANNNPPARMPFILLIEMLPSFTLLNLGALSDSGSDFAHRRARRQEIIGGTALGTPILALTLGCQDKNSFDSEYHIPAEYFFCSC